MFQDTGVLHGCVKGAVVAVAGCKAGQCAEMAPRGPYGLYSGIGVLSSV